MDRDGRTDFARAYGFADRAHEVPNAVDTQFGIASGTKGLTALTVVSLIESGVLAPATTARSLLGRDLPLIDDEVTVEHLLAHRSGIGDYLDEEAGADPTDYMLSVPVNRLASTADYVSLLEGHPAKFHPGTRFSYCNGGYVLLALIAERAAEVPFPELVSQRVCAPAAMHDTEFLRSDELPGRAAIGYLEQVGLQTNVLHLPVRGSGDGGVYSTAADVHALWKALFEGRIVSIPWVERMTRPRSQVPALSRRYGLGFWLHERGGSVMLEGSDAGVSFYSSHDPDTRVTWTVLSNTTRGAWPIVREVARLAS